MAKDKFPVCVAEGMEPAPLPGFKAKYGQESFDEAMNDPNDPKKRHRPGDKDTHMSYNVTDAYTEGDNSK